MTVNGTRVPITTRTELGHPVHGQIVKLPPRRHPTVVLTLVEPAGAGAPQIVPQPMVSPMTVTAVDAIYSWRLAKRAGHLELSAHRPPYLLGRDTVLQRLLDGRGEFWQPVVAGQAVRIDRPEAQVHPPPELADPHSYHHGTWRPAA